MSDYSYSSNNGFIDGTLTTSMFGYTMMMEK